MKKGDDVEDLMGLIELAEKSTDKLNKLKDQVFSLVAFGVCTIVAIFIFYFLSRQYLYNTLELSYFWVDIIVGSYMFIFVLFFGRKLIKIRKNIQSETKVSCKLYNLIDPLRSSLVDEMSIMKMATIEMRLSRIHFEGSGKKRRTYKPKTKEIASSKIQKGLSLES